MYDARIGGGFAPPPPAPPRCQGAACRPTQTAPEPASQGGSPNPPASKPAPPAPVASRLTISGSRSVKGTSLRLAAKVTGAGRLTVTGSGLVGTPRKTTRATTYHLAVRLSKASAAKLRRKHRLTVTATVRFVPSKGTARSVKVRLTFSAPSKSKSR
jgi:hypothetical protein